MRSLIYIGIMLCTCIGSQAQEYTLSYKGLPEMYCEVELLLLKNGATINYNTRKSNCKLTTGDAVLKNGKLSFNRSELYQTDGAIRFRLTCEDHTEELTLALPVLEAIRFNLYADSIKPVMNYYLNVEGVYSNGNIYPLDTTGVEISADNGIVNGMEWEKPEEINFEQVTFVAISKYKHTLTASTTVYLKKGFISTTEK